MKNKTYEVEYTLERMEDSITYEYIAQGKYKETPIWEFILNDSRSFFETEELIRQRPITRVYDYNVIDYIVLTVLNDTAEWRIPYRLLDQVELFSLGDYTIKNQFFNAITVQHSIVMTDKVAQLDNDYVEGEL